MRFMIFCLACLLTVGTAHAEKYFWVRAFKEGDKYEGSVVVKPLDDPANPYKDKYDDYDRWCVEHSNRFITLENHVTWQMGLSEAQGYPGGDKLRSGNYPEWDGTKALTIGYTEVDKDGFVVPHQWHPDQAAGYRPYTLREMLENSDTKWSPEPAGFWSMGYLEPAISEANAAQTDKEIAAEYPSIPKWMVTQNKDTVLLPDGGAIFVSDVISAPADVVAKYPGGKFYAERFSADGVQVKDMLVSGYFGWSKLLSDKPLRNQYFREYESVHADGDVGSYNNLHGLGGRYTIYRDREQGAALAVLDYWQDKLITPETGGADFLDKLTYDRHYFQQIDAQQLARIYMAQQEAKP
jgi:hypothetical protein